MKSFKYGELDLIYRHADRLISFAEVLLLDAYRADPLKNGGAVVDLRAGIGDFFFLASKRVGPDGIVVAHEHKAEDYEMLKTNIEKNGCENVIALTTGVSEELGKNRSLFGTGRYSFRADTLENILARLEVKKISFIKVDIEYFEAEVIKKQHQNDRTGRCYFNGAAQDKRRG